MEQRGKRKAIPQARCKMHQAMIAGVTLRKDTTDRSVWYNNIVSLLQMIARLMSKKDPIAGVPTIEGHDIEFVRPTRNSHQSYY
jgi:hypothetical protein